ncbi:hypothetical protein K8R32_05025, partial [bacterium]|nr:hypothetical protein [bacterium]
ETIIQAYLDDNGLSQQDLENNPGWRNAAEQNYDSLKEAHEMTDNDGNPLRSATEVEAFVKKNLDKNFGSLIKERGKAAKDAELKPEKFSKESSYVDGLKEVKRLTALNKQYLEALDVKSALKLVDVKKLVDSLNDQENSLADIKDPNVLAAISKLQETRAMIVKEWGKILIEKYQSHLDNAGKYSPEQKQQLVDLINKTVNRLDSIKEDNIKALQNKLTSISEFIEKA